MRVGQKYVVHSRCKLYSMDDNTFLNPGDEIIIDKFCFASNGCGLMNHPIHGLIHFTWSELKKYFFLSEKSEKINKSKENLLAGF